MLSETTAFLSRTAEYSEYELQLRALRAGLQRSSADPAVAAATRAELVALRGALRRRGYDLSLGGKRLRVDGWRDDSSLASGWRRLVLAFAASGIYAAVGDDNHVALAGRLEAALAADGLSARDWHCLWFRRRGADLELSASDSEGKDDFERFKALAAVNELAILGRMKGLG